MEIENSGDFEIFGVFGACLELQRGQVNIYKKYKSTTEKKKVVRYVKNIQKRTDDIEKHTL